MRRSGRGKPGRRTVSAAATSAPPAADLKAVLLTLPPTGGGGFEDLMALVISRVLGQAFRVLPSGPQGGRDLQSDRGPGQIVIECKLYKGAIPKPEVVSKIAELGVSGNRPDLWILATTSSANPLTLDLLRAVAEKDGVAILALDWAKAAEAPPLPAFLALAPDVVVDFFRVHRGADTARRTDEALKAVRESGAFAQVSEALVRQVADASIATPIARAKNRRWLEAKFASRAVANLAFGQPLAPNDPFPLVLRPRPALTAVLQEKMTGAPDKSLVVVTGIDGCGKSWSVAQAWLTADPQPLMLFVPATEVAPSSGSDLATLLLSKLGSQCGEQLDDAGRKRWEAKFRQWREAPVPEAPRFILWVDGLNQQDSAVWPSWLSVAAEDAEKLGGRLIVTVRDQAFDRWRMALSTNVVRLRAPEWELEEVRAILKEQGFDLEDVKQDTRPRLQNPRLLSIGLELIHSGALKDVSELSVERLMFEHIRLGVRDGHTREDAETFSRRLADHAGVILNRLEEDRLDDLRLFDTGPGAKVDFTKELIAARDGRFYQPTPGEPTLYQLTEDGLRIALGLAILQKLRFEDRNQRDPREMLAQLIEPVRTLDEVSAVIFAALLQANLEETSGAVIAALFEAYAGLQNVDGANLPAFRAIVRGRLGAALQALGQIVSTGRHAPQATWLRTGVRDRQTDVADALIIADTVRAWLRTASMAPELLVSRHADGARDPAELQRRREAIDEARARLTRWEAERLEAMDWAHHDPARLHREALRLIAGIPLASFADALVDCALSEAFNSGFQDAHRDLLSLVRFNPIDWMETRGELLRVVEPLRAAGVSRVGKWALVSILRALATPEDAAEEACLVEELTKDEKPFQGWRLLEDYCASDPCDPSSVRPSNLDETEARYGDLIFGQRDDRESRADEFHFLRDARPAIARFAPKVAVAAQRRQAAAVMTRSGRFLRDDIASLALHSAALDRGVVEQALEISRLHSQPRSLDSPESREAWVTSQYALLLALPHLDGSEQQRVLRALPPHGPPLLQLVEVMTSAKPEELVLTLRTAMASGDIGKKLAAVSFAAWSGTPISAEARSLLLEATRDPDSGVRAQAMAWIVSTGDGEAAVMLAAEGWSIHKIDLRSQAFEAWYGSRALILAVRRGALTVAELFDRILLSAASVAATTLGPSAHPLLAIRLEAALRRAVAATLPFAPPAVELVRGGWAGRAPPLYSVSRDPEDAFATVEEQRRLHDEAWDAFTSFTQDLTEQDARLIVEDVGFEAIAACEAAQPGWVARLAEVVLCTPKPKLRQVRSFALLLVRALATGDAALAERLLRRLQGVAGIVDLKGPAGAGLEAECVWSAQADTHFDRPRAERLDRARDDAELAGEVFGALRGGQEAFLLRYAEARLAGPQPATIVRGLAVLGFCDASARVSDLIAGFEHIDGYIGSAARSARYAYERNAWARTWRQEMIKAETPEQYWLSCQLFLKVVDPRFAIWADCLGRSELASRFDPLLTSHLENRFRRRADKRAKRLSGDEPPHGVYLSRAGGAAESSAALA